MASIKLCETKDGRRFYQISVSRGHGQSAYKTRWYWPDGWSQKTAEREAAKQAAIFEQSCHNGEVLTRAEQKAAREREEAEAAKLVTLRQYALNVYLPTKQITTSTNTFESYRTFLIRHILPALGDVLMVDITPSMIQTLLLDAVKAGYSKSFLDKLYIVLGQLFTMAMRDDTIMVNPMQKTVRPAPRKDSRTEENDTPKSLDAGELKYVLSCADMEPLPWRTYLYVTVDTGARRGEVCGLQWGDINFKDGTINIVRNLQYSPQRGVYETTPKNGRGRVVDVGPETISLLRELRIAQSRSCICRWVFSQTGTALPMHPQSPSRYFEKFGKKYGIKNFHPHLLRHTSASLAIINGADITSTAARLGHTDTATTLRMYSHATPESIRAAGQAVRDAVEAAKVKNG